MSTSLSSIHGYHMFDLFGGVRSFYIYYLPFSTFCWLYLYCLKLFSTFILQAQKVSCTNHAQFIMHFHAFLYENRKMLQILLNIKKSLITEKYKIS